MILTPKYRLLAALCLLPIGPFLATAQEAATESSATLPKKTSDIVTLSPFYVNTERDSGYQAVDGLVGGRIETALDRTPAAVSTLTRDFLDDIAVSSFTTAATWSTNAFLQSNGTSNFSEFQVNFRGVGSGLQTINYFTFQNQSDGYNTERLEFARGPNSILFGNGNLSGIPTTFTKQPKFRDFTQVQLRGDDFGGFRSTVDVNRQLLNGRAAIRFNGLWQTDPGWHINRRNDRRSADLAGAIRLGETAAIRFEAEIGQMDRSWSDQPFLDSVSNWDGKTVYTGTSGTTAAPVAGSGLNFVSGAATRDYYVFDPSRASLGLLNLRGFYTTTGQNSIALLPGETRDYIARFPSIQEQGFNVTPLNNTVYNKYNMATIYLEKQFSRDLFFQLAYNRNFYNRATKGNNWQTVRVDVNQYLPDGSPNLKFGQYYVDAQPTEQRQWNTSEDFRLLGSYKLATSWMEQRFSLLLNRTQSVFSLIEYKMVRTNNPTVASYNDAGNAVFNRVYFDQTKYQNYTSTLNSNGIDAQMWNNNYQEFPGTTDVGQLAVVGSYFDNKLTSILGLRRDVIDRETTTSSIQANNTLAFTTVPQTFGATTGSAGFVYYPVHWVGPFINYSESYAGSSLGAPLWNGGQPDPTSGRGMEYGVQLKLFKDRIQGRVSYYDSDESGRVINSVATNNINTIWTTMGRGDQVLNTAPRDTQTLNAKGFETDIVANLTKNWRTFFNFALPKTFQNNSLPGQRAYVAANLSAWQAAAQDPNLTDAARSVIAANIVTIQNGILGTNDGRANNGTMKFRGNIYSTYTFNDGRFKGLAFGGGAQFYGRQVIGNVAGQPFAYLYMKERTIAAAHVSYSGKFNGVRYRVQLNATNLLNNRDLIYTGVVRPTGLTYDVLNGYNYQEPRRFILSTTFDF